MDRHLIDAFLESLTDNITDRVSARLGLRPLAKAVDRESRTPPEALANTSVDVQTAPPTKPLLEYLSPRQAAEILGMTEEGLQKMRSEGRGPKFVKVGGRIRYRRTDLP